MSVAILRDESFGNVMRTLLSPSLRYERRYTIDICKSLGVSPNYWNLRNAVRLFVRRCVFFNSEAYRLRYHEGEVGEPVTSEELDRLENVGKVVSLPQLFITLSCIDYNADLDDHIDQVDSESAYELYDTFKEWHGQLLALKKGCAEAIAWEKAGEEECNWF